MDDYKMCRKCVISSDSFCYFYEVFMSTIRRSKVIPLIQIAYQFYFECEIGDRDKSRASDFCCLRCSMRL